jgi:hypothetical protein
VPPYPYKKEGKGVHMDFIMDIITAIIEMFLPGTSISEGE